TGAYWTDAWTLVGSCTSGARAADGATINDQLISNAPNPFISSTEIEVNVEQAGEVSVMIYDKAGQLVGTVVQGYLNAGKHDFIFDATNLKADLYLVKYSSASGVATQKMIKVQ
ncbi:MAG: Por secretion system C-terminal sorting protein, partial [Chitinophagaceae bacterium]|nr:Por secretion system C-terminal sorting protein [Chitinophagaceae bacterium]